jgi:hypothetical protein
MSLVDGPNYSYPVRYIGFYTRPDFGGNSGGGGKKFRRGAAV